MVLTREEFPKSSWTITLLIQWRPLIASTQRQCEFMELVQCLERAHLCGKSGLNLLVKLLEGWRLLLYALIWAVQQTIRNFDEHFRLPILWVAFRSLCYNCILLNNIMVFYLDFHRLLQWKNVKSSSKTISLLFTFQNKLSLQRGLQSIEKYNRIKTNAVRQPPLEWRGSNISAVNSIIHSYMLALIIC